MPTLDHAHLPVIDNLLPSPPDETPPEPVAVLPRPRPKRPGIFREILDALVFLAVIFTLANLSTARFIVDGASMAPNLATGQYVLVDRLSYLMGEPQRGDVVVFRSPDDDAIDLIKRIIGLPGETVSVRDGQVFINGQPLSEPNLAATPRYQGEWTLHNNEYFLLGDNRNNSRDSHSFGPVTGDHIIGKALLIYWPPQDWQLIRSIDAGVLY